MQLRLSVERAEDERVILRIEGAVRQSTSWAKWKRNAALTWYSSTSFVHGRVCCSGGEQERQRISHMHAKTPDRRGGRLFVELVFALINCGSAQKDMQL